MNGSANPFAVRRYRTSPSHQTCHERRIHHASRAVWSSCRDFRVISRNLGHGLTLYAAAQNPAATHLTKTPRTKPDAFGRAAGYALFRPATAHYYQHRFAEA